MNDEIQDEINGIVPENVRNVGVVDEVLAPEEEDGDDDEAEEEVDDNNEDEENRHVIEGGVARDAHEEGGDELPRNASQADIALFLTCSENFDEMKEHPILREGITVQIGMGKSTKLAAVFARYVEVCNEQYPRARVEASDLEFVHSQLLQANDTAEAAALMKNDRINVRRDRSSERQSEAEKQRIQRESDKFFFGLMRNFVKQDCDTILDCRGTISKEGRVQVVSTLVRCHGFLVSKRCPWLGHMIATEKRARQQRQLANQQLADSSERGSLSGSSVGSSPAKRQRLLEEDDDAVQVLPAEAQPGRQRRVEAVAAEIENDDEESFRANGDLDDGQEGEDGEDVRTAVNDAKMLWVTLPEYSPDAIRLLLEYLYTNRALPLGFEAFVQSCRTKPNHKHQGPVAPYPSGNGASRRWPSQGKPTVTFGVALATIELAEVAGIPRLSFMAEIAAAQMVTNANFIDAFNACELQKRKTGNGLARLRKAATDAALTGMTLSSYSLPMFRRTLEEQPATLIPPLMMGTMEAVEDVLKKKRQLFGEDEKEWQDNALKYLRVIDRQDRFRREEERRKRRLERLTPDRADVMASRKERWAPRRKGVKRMSHHLKESVAPGIQHRVDDRRRGSK